MTTHPKPSTNPKKKQSRRPVSRRSKRSFAVVAKLLPAFIFLALALGFSLQPRLQKTNQTGVLSYATNVAIADLLSSTNAQRSSNGAGTLTLNSQLSSAAQTKANDMVTRNYWSHVTPDGVQPWTFITNTGYQYSTAGENLAYGFMTSSDTITGWMNSAPHRANLLNTAFTEVGFGLANSSDFNNDGEETVVVAMYAAPQHAQAPVVNSVQAGTPSSPATPVASTPAPASSPASPSTGAAASNTEAAALVTADTAVAKTASQPITTGSTANISAKAVSVKRVQVLTGGKAAWSATVIVLAMCGLGAVYVMQRGMNVKKYILAGERFFIHHAYLDITVAALILLSIAMVSSIGVIR